MNKKKIALYTLAVLIILIITGIILLWPYLPTNPDDGSVYLEEYHLEKLYPDFAVDQPTNLVTLNDEVFVTERIGRVWKFSEAGTGSDAVVHADLRDRVSADSQEKGLLGIAFNPEDNTSNTFYIDYTHDDLTRISRIIITDSGVSETILLTQTQPYANHNGGQIAFGPDGYLYASFGDGGLANDPQGNGQDKSTILGSIIRIDVSGENYTIPSDNPFASETSSRGEIWAYGLRNAWRFSFDSNGTMWTGDVGQNKYEEVDIILKGKNYGWNTMEGFHCFRGDSCDQQGLELPIVEYDHTLGNSITGGFVYEGTQLNLNGFYIFGDFGTGRIWVTDAEGNMRLLLKENILIPTFGLASNGEILVLGFNGTVYKLVES